MQIKVKAGFRSGLGPYSNGVATSRAVMGEYWEYYWRNCRPLERVGSDG